MRATRPMWRREITSSRHIRPGNCASTIGENRTAMPGSGPAEDHPSLPFVSLTSRGRSGSKLSHAHAREAWPLYPQLRKYLGGVGTTVECHIGQMNGVRFPDRVARAAPPNNNVAPPIQGIFEQCTSRHFRKESHRGPDAGHGSTVRTWSCGSWAFPMGKRVSAMSGA